MTGKQTAGIVASVIRMLKTCQNLGDFTWEDALSVRLATRVTFGVSALFLVFFGTLGAPEVSFSTIVVLSVATLSFFLLLVDFFTGILRR